MSTDNSESVLQDLVQEHNLGDIVKTLYYKDKASSYAARNFGGKHANGNIFLFVDIDVWFKPDWLEIMKEELKVTDLVAGNVLLIVNDENNLSEHYDRAFSFDLQKYAREFTGITANLGCSKQVWKDLGGFKELTSGGDREFCLRAYSKGFSFKFSSQAICFHPCRNSFKENLKKVRRVALGKFEQISTESGVYKFKLIIKTFILSIIQPNTFRRLKLYFKDNPNVSKIRLTLYAVRIGFLSRFELIKLMVFNKR